MQRTETAEKMTMSPAVYRRALPAGIALALVVLAFFAIAGSAQVVRGGSYSGKLPGGGRISFLISDSGRRVQSGLSMSGLRAPCGGGVYVTLFNVSISQSVPIRGGKFHATQKNGSTVIKVAARFLSGRKAKGTVRVSFANGCHSGAIGFSAAV